MSRRLIIRDDAEADITEAALWYEERGAGLGLELTTEIHAAIRRAIGNPVGYCGCASAPRFVAF